MKLIECIPKDKFDSEAVKRATALGYPDLNPILPDLLVCLQDINWPVAPDVAALLSDAGTAIAPHVNAILNSTDGPWKYWVLSELGASLNGDVWSLIEADVVRLAEAPTPDDRDEEVHLVAAEVLAQRKKAHEDALSISSNHK